MSQNDDKNNELENTDVKGIDRREFIKRTAIGAGAVAATMVAGGCGGSSSSSPAATSVAATVGANSTTAWKFGIMADTQWLAADDGKNPNTSAIDIVQQLNQQFIAQGVKFVVQVGDLADQATGASSEAGYATTASICEDTRALFAQPLYNAGIGFFACRGNHDDGSAAEFISIFPQTQNGVMNATPAAALTAVNGASYPDTANQPIPAASSSATFTLGTNFSTIGSPANLTGLSYGFDYNNARFVFIDQFTPVKVGGVALGPDGNPYSVNTTANLQYTWIDNTLKNRASNSHAFVFSHKGLITQQHQDVLFGANPSTANSPGMDNFIRSMYSNGARMYFCGHDHIHNRCIVKTIDSNPAGQVTHVLCASNSSKFYGPNEYNASATAAPVPPLTSNDAHYCPTTPTSAYGMRQTQLSQELNTVGYYIVTVDGPTVTVDFYSASAYPTPDPTPANLGKESLITTTPALAFSKRETFGYGLNGKQFVFSRGDSLTTVQDTGPSGTVAKVLAGTNNNPNGDASGRKYYNAVNTGWIAAANNTVSDILSLTGMGYTLGSDQTDAYVLSLSYKSGAPVLATPDGNGNWMNAVDQNLGGAKKLVQGPWKAGYALGTYGIDTATSTVWAVINYNGYFAAVAGI